MEKDFMEYIRIMDTLGVHQMILQGPPGTSKTYNAKKIIEEGISVLNNIKEEIKEEKTGKKTGVLEKYQINSKGEGYWDMVQLHPSYGYEDFVRGITIKTENQQIQYETVNKIFGKMCKIAGDSKAKKYFLLIDEINRADVATVFGELIYALEYRNEAIETPYEVEQSSKEQSSKEQSSMVKSSKITVPDNLYIIGTMNTADKSVGNIDYAIRRRFIFFDLLPNADAIENGYAQTVFLCVNEFIKTSINTQYRANDFLIGHTYFLLPEKKKINSEKLINYRMEYQVLPILREYYIDGIIRLSNEASDNYLNKYLTGEVELSDEVKDEGNENEEKEKVIDKIINAFSLGENNGNATEDGSGEKQWKN